MTSPITVQFAETRWHLINPPRVFTEWERTVLDTLLSQPFPKSEELRQQAETVRVFAECKCCLSIALTDTHGRPHRSSNAQHGHIDMAMVAEIGGNDEDGVPFWVLFTHNGRLAEIEIQRADSTPFVNTPNIEQ